jgi:hypothetical protein
MTEPITFKIDFDSRPGAETFEYDVKTHKLAVNGKAVKTHELYIGGPVVYGTGTKTVTIETDGSKATLAVSTPICQINKNAEPIYKWTHKAFKPVIPQA